MLTAGGCRTPRPSLAFDVPELFLFGSPLAIMLLYRQMLPGSRCCYRDTIFGLLTIVSFVV